MLAAAKALSRVRALGVTIVPDGNRLRFHPASALTPELLEELRQHKEDILSILREEVQQDTSKKVASVGEVLELARNVLPELKEEDRVDLDELIQANSPPPPGRDPLVHRGSGKALFFKEGAWRSVPPTDWTPYRPEGAA